MCATDTVLLLLLHNGNHVRLSELVFGSLLRFDVASITQRLQESAAASGAEATFGHGAGLTSHSKAVATSAQTLKLGVK